MKFIKAEKVMKEIAERLQSLRIEKGMTLDMVADEINRRYGTEISKGSISRWENDKNDPSLESVAILADYFGVSTDYLAGLTDIRTPTKELLKRRKYANKEGRNK